MTTSCFPWEKKPSFPWDKPSTTDFRTDTSVPVKFGAPQPDFPPPNKPLALGVPSSRPLAEIEKPSFPWEKKTTSLAKRSNHVDPVEFKISGPIGEVPKAEYKFPWEKQPTPKEEEKKEEKAPEQQKVETKEPEDSSKGAIQTSLSVVKAKEKSLSSPKSTRNQRYKPKEEAKKEEDLKEAEKDKVDDEKGKDAAAVLKVEEGVVKHVESTKESEETPGKEDKNKTALDPEVAEKVKEIVDKLPKLSPKSVSRSSSRSSVRKISKVPSQSSVFTKGPVTSPPKHINKKSEKLAKNYKSACAKPKVVTKPLVVAQEGQPGAKKLSLRTAAYISNWVPAAPEAVGVTTWGPSDQRAQEYGNGLGPGVTVTKASPSSTSLSSSANIRDAVFMEWVEKKKVKRVEKYNPDPVLVLVNPEGIPCAENVRQAAYDDWYRKRATAQDKQIIKTLEEEENRQKMIAEREEEKKKKALATRKAWEANDENRKELIKCKKREEKEKEKKLQEEKDAKSKDADKTFNTWKEKKDARIKGEVKKRVAEEKECKKEQVMEKENKLTDAEKTFKAWKEAKEKELKSKAAEQRRLKEQKELEIQSEKYKKEKDRREKVREWEERKEREKSEINIPKHISPWKAAANTGNEPSRDDKLMTNLKYKKMKEKKKSNSEKPVEMVG